MMQMLINGQHVDSKSNETIDVLNSATQEYIDTVPSATVEDTLYAVEIAQQGKEVWGAMPQYQRSEILTRCAASIEENLGKLAVSLTTEMGKIIREARAEISVAAQIFRGFAEMANHLYGETMSDYQKGAETDIIFTRHEPLGVVACISPFNYPVELCFHKAAAALAAGNAVIIKPASDNPLTILRIVELCLEAGVPGSALQVVTGRGSVVGNSLAASPKINAVSLTGSTEVGIDVAQTAASTLKRVFLELGGNDPFIVFEDADLELSIQEAVAGRLKNAGQTCCSPKRFLVHRSVLEEFVEGLIESLKKIKTGSPLDEDTDFGSLISVRAAEEVKHQVDHTVGQGARCIWGGNLYAKTYFEPTVLVDVTPDMDISKDMEVFGPVFPIIVFDTFDEAIEIANNTPYGLQAGVMTRKFSTAVKAASKIQCGGIVINGSGNYRNTDQPFGGMKMSGVGREGISCTLSEMSQEKSYVLRNVLK